MLPLERALPLAPQPDQPPQAIVVLGGDSLLYGGPERRPTPAPCRSSANARPQHCIVGPVCRSW